MNWHPHGMQLHAEGPHGRTFRLDMTSRPYSLWMDRPGLTPLWVGNYQVAITAQEEAEHLAEGLARINNRTGD